jgi:group I intron endonuclease
MTTAVYVGRNLVNGKVYVGSAYNAEKRMQNHVRELKKKRHGNRHLQYAWSKYGETNFSWKIVEVCEPSLRLLIEQQWIWSLRASNPRYGYNVMHNVRSLMPSIRRSRLSRKMWSDADFKAKTRAKIKEAWNTPEHLEWLSGSMKAQWCKPEYRAKQSASMTERWQDPVYRETISDRRRITWQDPEYVAKIKVQRNRVGGDPAYRAGQGKDSAERWADPAYKEKLAAAHRAAWADPEKRARRLAGQAAGRARRAQAKARNEIV